MKLKTNLKLHLASKGLTAAELSRVSKVPKATISDWLSGRSPKNLSQLKSVANILETTIDNLAFGSFSESSSTPHFSFQDSKLTALGTYDVFLKKVK